MRTLAAFAGVALALAACQKGSPAAPAPAASGPAGSGPAASGPAASIRVQSDSSSPGPYSLGTLARLQIDASFPAAPGAHPVRIDVVRPDRGVHASLTGTAEPGPDGVAVLHQTLEVAGSPIEQYHLVGTWSFVLSVDDGPQVASASADLGD